MAVTPRDPRIERTRRVVLRATVEILAERGFAGASIDAIARRSGVARSTIYRHWPQLTDLAVEAVVGSIGPMTTEIVGDVRADLISILTHLADVLGSEPIGSVAASMILESRRDENLDELRRKFVGRRRVEATTIVRDAVARGDLPDEIDIDSFVDDLVAPVFFHTLVLRDVVGMEWIEGLVDRWLERRRFVVSEAKV